MKRIGGIFTFSLSSSISPFVPFSPFPLPFPLFPLPPPSSRFIPVIIFPFPFILHSSFILYKANKNRVSLPAGCLPPMLPLFSYAHPYPVRHQSDHLAQLWQIQCPYRRNASLFAPCVPNGEGYIPIENFLPLRTPAGVPKFFWSRSQVSKLEPPYIFSFIVYLTKIYWSKTL